MLNSLYSLSGAYVDMYVSISIHSSFNSSRASVYLFFFSYSNEAMLSVSLINFFFFLSYTAKVITSMILFSRKLIEGRQRSMRKYLFWRHVDEDDNDCFCVVSVYPTIN